MMKKALAALVMSGMMASAQAGFLVNEGFDDVTTLAGKGWVINNQSTPGGTTSWYQGDEQIFSALSGAPNSYIAANYESSAEGGRLANWLISPEFSTAEGARISFWLRGAASDIYSDKFSFGYNLDGSTDLRKFDMLRAMTVGTDGWVRYEARIEKGSDIGTARFALLYAGAAADANYIGLDNLAISEIPEPSSMLILGAGVMGLVASRRRQRR